MNFNGNNINVDLGGTHGDTGWQIQSTGIRIRGDSRIINIDNCHVIYSALDGLSLVINTTTETDSSNVNVTNSSFLYCSRQGCTIAGGTNHVFTNCKFNFSGQGGFRSAPAAGIDIEPEAGGAYGIKFINCESIGNKGVCLVCDLRGEVDRIVWDGGTLWGTSSHALWWAALGSLKIINAQVYGQIRFLSKGLLENCVLGDIEHSEYGIYRTSRTSPIYDSLGGEFNNCTLYVYGQKWFGGNTPKLTNCKLIARLDGENEEITEALDGRLLASLNDIESVKLEDECIKGKFVNKPYIIIPYTTKWTDSLKGQGLSANLKGVIHIGSTTVPVDNNDDYMLSGGCNNISMERWRENLTWRYRNSPINNEEFAIGSLLFRTSSINSDLGIVCTTEGISGSTAVFKNFGGVQ